MGNMGVAKHRAAGIGAILMALAAAAPAGEVAFEVVERLNRAWRSQLIHHAVEASEGAFHKGSARLSGPDGPIPVQLTEAEYWGETPFVKRASAAFFVPELLPLATNRYILSFGPKAVKPARADGLNVSRWFGRMTITTPDVGIRLLHGSKTYRPPAPAAEVPGPVKGLRLHDGRWTGGSALYGTNNTVVSYVAEGVESGPVYASAKVVYTYADSHTVTCRFRVVGGDHAVEIETLSSRHGPEDGWTWTLGGDGTAFPRATMLSGRAIYTRADEAKAPFDTSLAAWTGDGWFRWAPMLLRLRTESPAGEVHLTSRDAGAWYEPRPLEEIADFTRWRPHTMGGFWRGWRDTRLAVGADAAGTVTVTSHNGKGCRRWTVSVDADGARQAETFAGKAGTAHTPHPRLDEVNAMVLEWPDGEPRNPHLLLSAEELQAAAERDPAAFADLSDLDTLRKQLDLLGEFDLMRYSLQVAGRYDALINRDGLDGGERRLLRAQAAYLMYRMASPYNWSVERGYGSGNPNMSVSHHLNAGMMALALRDHPLSAQWVGEAARKMDFWLDQVIDASGTWPESSHYARVSWANMVRFGIAATRAGVRDYLGNPKFRAAALFHEQTLTPPDPSRPTTMAQAQDPAWRGVRVNAPYGRGVRFDVWGFGGLLARAYAERDPEFSAVMQWSWAQTGYGRQASHNLAGMESLYPSRDLPIATPAWESTFYPNLGYLLRNHVGAPDDESYLLLVSRYLRNADGEIWPADTGMIAKWFAYGMPVASAFTRVSPETAHVLLNNRVLLACNWDPEKKESPPNVYQTTTRHEGFARLPEVEYVNVGFAVTRNDPAYSHNIPVPPDVPAFPVRNQVGETPFDWRRQLLRVDDGRAGGRQYVALRDTVSGGQPTQWHFWTLSEKLGETAAAADREAFLADKPGNKAAPRRELTGDRFTAIGQFGVDVEAYVASPGDTPRYTLRYGTQAGAYGAWKNTPTYQDLLHLQLPGDGSYFVVLYPHPAGHPAPEFATLGDGRIVRVRAEGGTDYLFMSDVPAQAEADSVRFDGTAGTVRLTEGRIVLSVAAPGSTAHEAWAITATTPAALAVTADTAGVSVDATNSPVTVTLRLTGDWEPVAPPAGAGWQKREDGRWQLELPAGVEALTLRKSG